MPIERDGKELIVSISGIFSKGHKGNYYVPPEPSSVDDIWATFDNDDIELTPKEQETAVEILMENERDAQEAAAEFAYDMRMEDLHR